MSASNDCVFSCLSSVILLFAFVTKSYYCLFIRAFIFIDTDKGGIVESIYMVMFTETEFPVLRELPKKEAFFKP